MRSERRRDAPSRGATRAPLRVAFASPSLLRCQTAAGTARLVDMATLVAVSVHLYSRSGAAAVAAFGVARSLVPAILTPFLTAAAGRRSPRWSLTACAAVAAGGSVAMALLIATGGSVPAILATAGCTGVVLYAVRPLITALLPGYIKSPTELVATNAAAALVDNVSTLGGPLLAGAALATIGADGAMWVTAALLAVSAAATATLADGPGRVLDPRPDPTGWLRDTIDGMRLLVARGPIPIVVALSVGQTLVRGGVNVLVVALAIESLDMGDSGVGLLLGAIGVGGFVGFPLARRLAGAHRMARALGLAVVLWGAPLVLVGHAPTPAVALLLFGVIGVGNNVVDITSDTLLQRLVPHGALPRALGAFDAVLYAGMALGAVAAERLFSAFGLTTALTVTGAVLPLLAGATWHALRRMDRRLNDRDADIALLQLNGIFSPLVMSTVDHLAHRMVAESFLAGDVILRQGDDGDRFLLIEEGDVEILHEGRTLAMLGPGDGFGEMALLHDVPRSATAVARSPVRARSLLRADFLAGVTSQDESHEAVLLVVDERQRRPVGG